MPGKNGKKRRNEPHGGGGTEYETISEGYLMSDGFCSMAVFRCLLIIFRVIPSLAHGVVVPQLLPLHTECDSSDTLLLFRSLMHTHTHTPGPYTQVGKQGRRESGEGHATS